MIQPMVMMTAKVQASSRAHGDASGLLESYASHVKGSSSETAASPKPTILVVTSTLPRWRGDSEPRFVLDLCEAVSAHYRLVILAPHCRGAAISERWDEIEVRRFRYLPVWGEVFAYDGGMLPKLRQRPWLWGLVPFYMVALIAGIILALRREPVALVHAHWMIPQGLCVRIARFLAGRYPPMICTAHGADVFGLRGRFACALQRGVAQGCVQVGAVSEALRDELIQRGVPAAKVRLMPMGVYVPDVLPESPPRQPQLVAFAGRLVEKKGVGVLLEAFHLLAFKLPEVRLCVAGGGPELQRYRRQAALWGLDRRIEFLGPVSHERVRGLFEQAAVAVMPSVTARDGDAEGLGLVMLEAMAVGCPVIVTDLRAVRGVIRPGVNGLLFPERDALALGECIEQLLTDRPLASRLAVQGYQEAMVRFSWKAVAANHETVYAAVMAAHLRRAS